MNCPRRRNQRFVVDSLILGDSLACVHLPVLSESSLHAFPTALQVQQKRLFCTRTLLRTLLSSLGPGKGPYEVRSCADHKRWSQNYPQDTWSQWSQRIGHAKMAENNGPKRSDLPALRAGIYIRAGAKLKILEFCPFRSLSRAQNSGNHV